MRDDIEVEPGLVIPGRELQFRFTPTGGPGGQHANRSSTRVDLVFDVAASEAFDEETKRLLLERLGPRLTGTTLVIVADETRSQWRNRAIARRRLAEVVRAARKKPRRRRPTRPSGAARRRRLEDKRARGEKKRMRRKPEID